MNELKKVEEAGQANGYHSKEKAVVEQVEPYIAGSRERHNHRSYPMRPRSVLLNAVVTAMKHRLQMRGRRSIGSPRRCGVIKLGFRRFHLRGLAREMESGVHGESEAAVCPGRRISGVSPGASCGAGTGAGCRALLASREQPQSLPNCFGTRATEPGGRLGGPLGSLTS